MARPTQRTAYLGPEASFSHQAAAEALPHTQSIPLPSFKVILQAVQDTDSDGLKAFDYAVLPVENSTNGSVVQAMDLIAQCSLHPEFSTYPDVEIIDEYYLEVHHCLFVSKAWAELKLSQHEIRSLPVDMDQAGRNLGIHSTNAANHDVQTSGLTAGSHLEQVLKKLNITSLHTHPQVWGQCNNILSALLPPGLVDRVDVSSTSAAAAFVADPSNTPNDGTGIAAISSSLAGAKHKTDLTCIARNIEDEPGANTTRFLILRNRNRPSPPLHAADSAQGIVQMKSLWVFTIAHFRPGALAAALAVFAAFEFNLSAIQSRPRPKRKDGTHDRTTNSRAQDNNWRYVFFVESLHSRDAAQLGDKDIEVERLWKELEGVTEHVSMLGSWRDRLS